MPKSLRIVVISLVAEGCPQLAAQLLSLQPEPTDRPREVEAFSIPMNTCILAGGLARAPRLGMVARAHGQEQELGLGLGLELA